MVTEIIIENKEDLETGLEVYNRFYAETGLELEDYAVTKLSEDKSKAMIYTDLEEQPLHKLMMIIIDLGYDVFKVTSRTPNYAKKLYYDFCGDPADLQLVKRFAGVGKSIKYPSSHTIKMNPTKKPAVNWLSNICWN